MEVANITKTWSLVGNPNKTDEHIKLTSGDFKCPRCKKRFLKVLGEENERGIIKGVVEEIKGIEKGLTTMIGDLREKIDKLKNERAKLLEEIEELKRKGETKTGILEKEIASLREEVESLKEILDDNE